LFHQVCLEAVAQEMYSALVIDFEFFEGFLVHFFDRSFGNGFAGGVSFEK
jgi:hypothetical protein